VDCVRMAGKTIATATLAALAHQLVVAVFG
jgi:hypothetical protein